MDARLAALKTEIDTDPLARGYAAMTDEQVAANMNAIDRPIPIPAIDAKRYLQLQGKWGAISDDSRNSVVEATRRACLTLVDALADFAEFDMIDASVSAAVNGALDALVSTGHILATDKTAILALGDDRQSRGVEVGAGVVRVGDVNWVRTYA